jgi:hypothetical protein
MALDAAGVPPVVTRSTMDSYVSSAPPGPARNLAIACRRELFGGPVLPVAALLVTALFGMVVLGPLLSGIRTVGRRR